LPVFISLLTKYQKTITPHRKEYNIPPHTNNGVNVDAKNITRFLRKRSGEKTQDNRSKIKKNSFFVSISLRFGSPKTARVRQPKRRRTQQNNRPRHTNTTGFDRPPGSSLAIGQ